MMMIEVYYVTWQVFWMSTALMCGLFTGDLLNIAIRRCRNV